MAFEKDHREKTAADDILQKNALWVNLCLGYTEFQALSLLEPGLVQGVERHSKGSSRNSLPACLKQASVERQRGKVQEESKVTEMSEGWRVDCKSWRDFLSPRGRLQAFLSGLLQP